MNKASTDYWDFPYTSQRMPVLADSVVSTSQPLASTAGLQMLAKGGNAMDAAIATAIALTVVEPCMNGIGGDVFMQVWDGNTLHGLNSSGRAPAAWIPERFKGLDGMPLRGWDSVTVPGAVAGWRAAWEKFGSLPFIDLFEPAIRLATDGFLVSPTVHRQWQEQVAELSKQPGFSSAFAPAGRGPNIGERFICPGQARTLEIIARTNGDAFYHGELAQAIVRHAIATGGSLTLADLAAHRADWVTPISTRYRDIELHQIGPSGQGIGALMALGMLESLNADEYPQDSPERVHLQLEAMKLAFADMYAYVADPDHMQGVTAAHLLDPAYLAERAKCIDRTRASYPGHGQLHNGGTVYLTAADSNGMMVSFIQSNFKGFGSGIVVPDTGIALQNRGWGFSTKEGHPNQVAPGKRPFHTIIPGFLFRNGKPWATLGVMGGSMQSQGHFQMAVRLAGGAQNPQAAMDGPRWRVKDDNMGVAVEWNMPMATVEGLGQLGHAVQAAGRFNDEFGCAQIIQKLDSGGYLAASDSRKDGYAVGL